MKLNTDQLATICAAVAGISKNFEETPEVPKEFVQKYSDSVELPMRVREIKGSRYLEVCDRDGDFLFPLQILVGDTPVIVNQPTGSDPEKVRMIA